VDSVVAAKAGVMIEAMMLRSMLQPMARAAGFLGESGIDELAREIASRDARAFRILLDGAGNRD
jgi:hypothetical protein